MIRTHTLTLSPTIALPRTLRALYGPLQPPLTSTSLTATVTVSLKSRGASQATVIIISDRKKRKRWTGAVRSTSATYRSAVCRLSLNSHFATPLAQRGIQAARTRRMISLPPTRPPLLGSSRRTSSHRAKNKRWISCDVSSGRNWWDWVSVIRIQYRGQGLLSNASKVQQTKKRREITCAEVVFYRAITRRVGTLGVLRQLSNKGYQQGSTTVERGDQRLTK